MNGQGSPLASHARLLWAGKALFAEQGYEQASTSAIARKAETSESQLVRYFDGKRGLLEAIFDESWRLLNQQIGDAVRGITDPKSAIPVVLSSVIAAFVRDPELAHLFLFEGRRIRAAGPGFQLSQGYLNFVAFLQRLIRQAQKAGTVTSDVKVSALSSALIGAAEGMIRDRLIAARSGRRPPFSTRDVHRVFAALLEGIGPPRASRARRKRSASGAKLI